MRYKVEIIYNNGTFDIICHEKYSAVVHLIKNIRNYYFVRDYKEIRVYKMIGQYKNENMEIQHND